MSLRVAFVGCVEMSHLLLEHLLTLPGVHLVAVGTKRASSFNSDFRSLEDLADQANCPVFLSDGRDDGNFASFLAAAAPQVTFCFGWSHLFSAEVLRVAPLGTIGFHPAALPANRGRHPIVWALALGLKETASTFFLMQEGADTGPIVSMVAVPIAPADDAGRLYEKIAEVARRQLEGITVDLAAGPLGANPQDDTLANAWRKRGKADGRIDWRMSPQAILDLIRALGRPYVGAHLEADCGEVKVWRAEAGPDAPTNLEPGKILKVDGETVLVKCWSGSVRLLDHEFPVPPREGSYL